MSYAVKEIFNTIQGEGSRAGTRAVFLRFSGCNLWSGREQDRTKGAGACARWCDTEFFGGAKMSAAEIIAACEKEWPHVHGERRWVVLTGGEPALQVDEALLAALHDRGWYVAMETNGTLDPGRRPGMLGELLTGIDHLCVSPKLGGELKRLRADDLKVVVPGSVGNEPRWTEDAIRALVGRGEWKRVYIQPQDGPDRVANVALALDMVYRNPSWRLSVQVHKTIGVR